MPGMQAVGIVNDRSPECFRRKAVYARSAAQPCVSDDAFCEFRSPPSSRKRRSVSFRALKSELPIRPLFHQLEPRVKAHVMVAFLGCAPWVTLKHLLKRRATVIPTPSASGVDSAQPMSPMRVIALLSTLQSADIVLPTTDGREVRLRRITEPTAEQKSLLPQLGISFPEHLQFNRECSANSAIA